MIFHVLGSGCSELNPQRSSPSYLVRTGEQTILMDLGQGAWRRLMEAEVAPTQVEAVLLTHHHLDHMADLLPLLFALNYDSAMRERARVTLVAHTGFAKIMDGLAGIFGQGVQPPAESFTTRWLRPGDGLELGSIRLSSLATSHIETSLAYRLEWEGESLVYLGDSALCSGLADFAQGADLLVCHTVGDAEHPNPKHMHAAQAGQLAARAEVGGLVLSHLYAGQDPNAAVDQASQHYRGPIWAARDHLKLVLGDGGAKEKSVVPGSL